MKLITCSLVFLLTLFTTVTGAEESMPATGAELLRNCQFFSEVSNLPWGWEVLDVNQAVTICLAFMDKLITQQKKVDSKKTYCLPEDVINRQLAATFVTYARKFPGSLEQDADSAASEVLRKAYPCK